MKNGKNSQTQPEETQEPVNLSISMNKELTPKEIQLISEKSVDGFLKEISNEDTLLEDINNLVIADSGAKSIIETLSKNAPIASSTEESIILQRKINNILSVRDNIQNKLFEKLVECYGS